VRPYLFDRDGNPIDAQRFDELLADAAYRIVARDDVLTGDGRALLLSTIWRGVDLGAWLQDWPGELFESMLFERGYDDLGCWRWPDELQATQGHSAILAALHAGVLALPNREDSHDDADRAT